MDLASISPGSLTLTFICALLLFVSTTRRRQKLLLPPGPPRLPIIGNALDIPSKNMGTILRGLSAKYGEHFFICFVPSMMRTAAHNVVGDVVYLEVFGQPMVLLGTHDAAKDLLERRSSKYSDKPPFIMSYL